MSNRGFSLITDDDSHLFNEGSHFRLYDKLGAHVVQHAGETRHLLRRLGAQRATGFGHRQLQRLGQEPPAAFTRKAAPASGKASFPASVKARLYKYHIRSRVERLPRRQGRSVLLLQ